LIINDLVLDAVEKILEIKLYDLQRKYILGQGGYWYGARRSGKTLAYCIKLALSDGEPLNTRKAYSFCDDDYGNSSNIVSYSKWFLSRFMEIWSKLKDAGFPVREVEKCGRWRNE